MSKKVKALVLVLVTVVVLTVGGVTMVMAQEEPTPTPEAEAKGLLERVADILDIPKEDLINAFKQAQQEMRQEAFIRFLDKAVEEGRLTPKEADEIRGWWAEKPEALNPALFPHALRGLKVRRWLRLHKLAH